MGRKPIDETGNTYGKIQVIGRSGIRGKQAMWQCSCDCGNIIEIAGASLRCGRTTSCGCSQNDSITKHGMTGTPTYVSWQKMKDRCYNPNFKQYHDYGGKGVTVCDRWLEPDGKGFLNFLEDMGERPEGMTLNRVQRSSVYSKETCNWATDSVQNYDKISGIPNTSGRVGVWWDNNKSRWIAEIRHNGRKIYLGQSVCFETACKLRSNAEMKYFGFTKERDTL